MRAARLAAAALCALLALAAAGPVGAELPAPVRQVLANGLTVIVQENRATPIAAASLFVRGGAGVEAAEETGISHLLQQVLVKGTATRSALEIAETAEGMGGEVTASADMDFCEVRGTALSRRWRGLLDLLADVALRPSLPPGEIEAERRLALRAIRNRRDQPFPLALDTLLHRLYGDHPYGKSSLGQPRVVERLDRAALLAHYRRQYVGRRMILSVSGDVTPAEVVAEAARLFAVAPPGEALASVPTAQPAGPLDRASVVRPSAQAQVVVGFLAPPVSHPDYAAVKVLSTALGGGMAGRLFTELRDRQGLAYSTSASYPTRIGPSFLVVQLGTAPANVLRAEEGIRRELERVREDPMGTAEVERAKSYLLGQLALDRRTNARLAWYAAFFESAGVGHDFAGRYVRQVEAVTAADVQRAARSYLVAPAVVSLGPPPR